MPTPLPVVDPWYKGGLSFTCTQCGNCCTGGPGYVWISDTEIDRLAGHLKLTRDETLRKYCRKIGGTFSLKERKTEGGLYDCVFLTTQVTPQPDGTTRTKRGCSIYPVRPLQCRTWPFWDGLLSSEKAWERAQRTCPGMGSGKAYTLEQIEALRTATDWPADAPGSRAARECR